MTIHTILFLFIVSSVLITCGDSTDQISPDTQITPIPSKLIKMPVFDQKVVSQGATLYQNHCSECHGKNAEGAGNWRSLGIDDNYPPPPLDDTGHAWHHPLSILMDMVKEGSRGGGNMPGWKDKLSDEEINSIITWTQTLWSENHYKSWLEIDGRSEKLFSQSSQ